MGEDHPVGMLPTGFNSRSPAARPPKDAAAVSAITGAVISAALAVARWLPIPTKSPRHSDLMAPGIPR